MLHAVIEMRDFSLIKTMEGHEGRVMCADASDGPGPTRHVGAGSVEPVPLLARARLDVLILATHRHDAKQEPALRRLVALGHLVAVVATHLAVRHAAADETNDREDDGRTDAARGACPVAVAARCLTRELAVAEGLGAAPRTRERTHRVPL